MRKTRAPRQNDASGGLAAPIALALAVKVAALTVLYFVFFAPQPMPSAERAASAILGAAAR